VDFGFVRFLPRDLQTFPYFNLPHSDFSQLYPLSSVLNPKSAIPSPQSEMVLFLIQSKGGVQNPDRQFGILFFDYAGNPDFRGADHHNVYIFAGQG
jgi:hypothetical protein